MCIMHTVRDNCDFESHVRTYSMMWDIIWQLSKMGLRVLCHVMKDTGKDKDFVYLNTNDVRDILFVSSRTSVYNAIEELVEWQILAKGSDKDKYWVNPSLMFKGARAKWYSKSRLVDKDNPDLEVIRIGDVTDIVKNRMV